MPYSPPPTLKGGTSCRDTSRRARVTLFRGPTVVSQQLAARDLLFDETG